MKPAWSTMVFWLVYILGTVFLSGQSTPDTGTISGRVLDSWNASGLGGVAVTVRGTTLGVKTDGQGRYLLQQVPPGNHLLLFVKSGYSRATVSDVKVATGQTSSADVSLKPEFHELEPFEVIVEPFDEKSIQLLGDRQSGAALVDSIGSDFFSRAGANDAADIMTKVTGASVVGGKYVFIRGLGERYSNTTLNGAEVPSADPDKKAVQMDIFPASAIDTVVTTKTFTPDQPGSFSGGSVDIKTKSFPDKFFLQLSFGTTFNTEGSLRNDFLGYDGGDMDWVGFDDGTRELPAEIETGDLPTRFDLLVGTPAQRQAAANELVRLSRTFAPQMYPEEKDSFLDHNFAVTLGNKMKVNDNDFGYIAGFSYDRDFSMYENGITGRYDYDAFRDTMVPNMLLEDTRSVQEISWGGLFNTAYRFNDTHEIGFNFLYNRNSEDEARIQSGFLQNTSSEDSDFYTSVLHWTERDLISYQLRGEHEIPAWNDAKTEWVASYATTSQDEPDFRVFSFERDRTTDRVRIQTAAYPAPTRYFRNLDESNINLKLDETIPFDVWNEREAKVKFGAYFSDTERNYQERRFFYESTSSPRYADFINNGDPLAFLDPASFNTTPVNRLNKFIVEPGFNNYTGMQRVDAGYLMAEIPTIEKLRLIGGARFEKSEILVENFGEAVSNNPNLKSSTVDNADWLGSASAVYEILPDFNLRLAYGQTLARPTFREIALVPVFEFANGEILVGNPDLKQTSIENYDLRLEWFPRPGEVLAFSAFYKTMLNPIEKTIVSANRIVQFQNRDEATVMGFELEARKNLDFISDLLSDFSLGSNFTWIESEVNVASFENVGMPNREDVRSLAGQSDYIANFDLTYARQQSGTVVSLFYNVFGERLSEVSRVGPNVFEQPVHTVDAFISQELGRGWKVKLSAGNLLDPQIEKVQTIGGQEFVYSSYNRGRSFGLSFNWEF